MLTAACQKSRCRQEARGTEDHYSLNGLHSTDHKGPVHGHSLFDVEHRRIQGAFDGCKQPSQILPDAHHGGRDNFAGKVFVIGAGVAGLQAIATAKRLGASVTATDSRRIVAEQIRSLGGKYVGVESDEDAQTDGGFAKELSADFKRKQEALIAAQCVASNVVITTALIGGVSAPRLITSEMVAAMKPGSVIVDLAAEGGGNCELSRAGRDDGLPRGDDHGAAQRTIADAS